MSLENLPASPDEVPNKIENIQERESITITLPEDPSILKALDAKLVEYKKRLDEQVENNPYQPPEFFTDTIYKIYILESLIDNGEVKMYNLSKEINDKYGYLDVDDYYNAYSVIEDYAKTGGKNNSGGTGFNLEQE